jgi:hypothetical protein
MKKRNKSRRQQQEKSTSPTTTDLSSFSLAAAISEFSATTASSSQQQPQQPQRKIFNTLKKSSHSQQSIATNASFATANESVTPAVSYFVDSSDEDTNEGLNFENDPLAVLSRTTSSDATPTEISFNINPEETTIMSSKKSFKISNTTPTASMVSESTPPPTTTTPPAPKKDPSVVSVKKTEGDGKDDDAHFDVAQNVYGTAKNIWAWGKTVPVITTLLGLTENVASKVLDTTIHMDLPAIDEKAVKPQLKKLDDGIVTPAILAVWNIIGPAIAKGDEMVVKPILTEVAPRVLGPLGLWKLNDKEKEKKMMEEKKAMIDSSPTPEVVPALN